jgi:hypothetical protein
MSATTTATQTITVSSPPTTAEATAIGLAYMAAASGVTTDYNIGSQVRTFFESAGEIIEEQGIIGQALAYQAIVYGAYQAFGIVPLGATSATGTVTFATGSGGSPPAAAQNINIAAGTIVQTVSGVQFQTVAAVTIPIGSTSASVGVIALLAGSSGNVSIGSISVITSTQAYYLVVTNAASITNGSNAETSAQTFARFTATVQSLGEASPVSIANACVGVTNGSEIVRYANVYEPWVTSMASPLPVGYQVYIDNGSGTASSQLVANVLTVLMGNLELNEPGYHPAGVPFTVAAGTPVDAYVVVTATLTDSTLAASLESAIVSSLDNYFNSLGFAETAQSIQVIAAVANVLSGYITSLSVTLENSSSTPVSSIAAAYNQRVILAGITATLT